MLLNFLELSIFMYIYQILCIINYYYCWLINLIYCWYLKVFQNQILFVTFYDFNKNTTTVLYRFYDLFNLCNDNQFFKRNSFITMESLSNDFMYEVTWVEKTTRRSIFNPTTLYNMDGTDFSDFQRKFLSLTNNESSTGRQRYEKVLSVTFGKWDLTSVFKDVCGSFVVGMKVIDFTRYAILRIHGVSSGCELNGNIDSLEIIDDDTLDIHTFKGNKQLVDIHV